MLKWEDVEIGEPNEGEICVKNKAIGLNFIDVYFRKGVYKADTFPFTPGFVSSSSLLVYQFSYETLSIIINMTGNVMISCVLCEFVLCMGMHTMIVNNFLRCIYVDLLNLMDKFLQK